MNNIVIIDNGHGKDTPGKRSPDGVLKEWEWTRRCARKLAQALPFDCHLLVKEADDVPLYERCQRVNKLCAGKNAVLVSLHTNASGDGRHWGSASGWSVFVAPHASEASRRLAKLLFDEAAARRLLGNRRTLPEGFMTGNFAICRDTRCPAVLTENLFHDNNSNAEFLLSADGTDTIVELHAAALLRYFDTMP